MNAAEIRLEDSPGKSRPSLGRGRFSFISPAGRGVDAFLTLGVLAFVGLEPSVGGKLAIAVAAVSVLVAMFIFCRRWMSSRLQDAAILVILLYALGMIPVVGMWPMVGALSLAITAGIAWHRKTLHDWRAWFRAGRIDAAVWGWFAVIVALTVGGLLLWMFLLHGQLPAAYASAARSVPRWAAAIGGVLFLIVNGIIEDAILFGVRCMGTAASGSSCDRCLGCVWFWPLFGRAGRRDRSRDGRDMGRRLGSSTRQDGWHAGHVSCSRRGGRDNHGRAAS